MKQYDRHHNGFLEINEYIECLRKENVDLKDSEIITMTLTADTNGDQRIDYEECMLYFTEILRMIRFQASLQETYSSYKNTGSNQSLPGTSAKPQYSPAKGGGAFIGKVQRI